MVRVVQWVGRVVVSVLNVLAGVLTSFGSGGIVGAGAPPTPTPNKPDDYRP